MAKNDEETKPLVYEVLFSGKKDKEDVLLGPVRVKATNRLVAVAKAGIQSALAGDFKDVSLVSLEVSVRGF